MVVDRSIPVGGYGLVQIWGYCDYIRLVGFTSAGAEVYNSVTQVTFTTQDIYDVILLPSDWNWVTTYPGKFLVIKESLFDNRPRDGSGPPVVMMADAIISDGSTTYGTLPNLGYGVTKGFIRCL